jgi:hypothetical protein
MESYDERRRRDEERRQARNEDRGRDRDSWFRADRSEHDEDRPRRAERGWLDYDRDYGGSGERQGREQQRYGQGGDERSRFSPDWSRQGAEPRYSDDPYYSRNRGRELAERGDPRDYDDPNWPYDRGERSRNVERSRSGQRQRGREDEGSHYRGWYSRSGGPFSYEGGQGYVFSESLTLHGPFTGRGPKGYKRSDQQIVEEACQRLERDGEVDASEIEVTAEDGVIRLRGTVDDRQTKRRAEQCVESIYGARDVMNELRVSQQSRESQGTQTGRGQTSQGAQGTQAPTLGQRPGAGSSTAEQVGDDKRTTPRH